MNSKVLVVDDSKTDMLMIKSILFDYDLLFAYDGLEAMEAIAQNSEIDLVILDLNMPKMDGFEVLQAIRDNVSYQHLITLILTNHDETENEIRGLDLGAVDYIRKPLNMESLRKRIEIHLHLKQARKCIEEQNAQLEKRVAERTRELVATRNITIHALIGLLEVRNIESSNHALRTQWMMRALCEQLKNNPKFANTLTEQYMEELFNTAPLHDIGKVGIPDHILLKPGKLTSEEFEVMKLHTTFGVEALSRELRVEEAASFILTAIEIAGCHHEKYNGTGYPKGLKSEQIPLGGRLMAIVDVYDALTSKRVYKEEMSHEESMNIILSERGQHFDPVIVDAFVAVEAEIRAIRRRYMQHNEEA